MILPKPRTAQLKPHLLNIVRSRSKKIHSFEMWHGFLWQWNGIYQFYQENFFLKKLRLGIHNTYNTNLQTIRRTKNINNPGHTISSFKIIWFSVIVMPRHKHEFMYWFTPNKATKYKNFQQLYSEADVSCCERIMKLEFHKKWGPTSLNQQFNEASDNHLVLWYNSSSLLTHKYIQGNFLLSFLSNQTVCCS